jgi:hypothetical protein
VALVERAVAALNTSNDMEHPRHGA